MSQEPAGAMGVTLSAALGQGSFSVAPGRRAATAAACVLSCPPGHSDPATVVPVPSLCSAAVTKVKVASLGCLLIIAEIATGTRKLLLSKERLSRGHGTACLEVPFSAEGGSGPLRPDQSRALGGRNVSDREPPSLLHGVSMGLWH